jgi:hypothetical protein
MARELRYLVKGLLALKIGVKEPSSWACSMMASFALASSTNHHTLATVAGIEDSVINCLD